MGLRNEPVQQIACGSRNNISSISVILRKNQRIKITISVGIPRPYSIKMCRPIKFPFAEEAGTKFLNDVAGFTNKITPPTHTHIFISIN